MEWHYADAKEKRGPLSEVEIQSLITSGKIKQATLVWNPAFTEWKPAGETALFSRTSSAESATQRCLITGKFFPVSQMISTEHGWVSAEGKDLYYQSLRENAPLPVAPGMTNARRSGRKLVIPITGGQLPLRCVKTGAPVTTAQMKSKTLYWCNPWAALTILLNVLVYLIVYLAIRKKVIVAIPLSPGGKAILRKHAFIAIGLGVAGVAAIIIGIAQVDRLASLIVLGFILLLTGLIYGLFKANALRIAKIKNGEAWITGACPEFLNDLPEY